MRRRLVVSLVDGSRQAAWWVVIGSALVAALLLYFAVPRISLDTDPDNLLDPTLPFRQRLLDFERTFPQLADLIVVVIESDNPFRAEEAADKLAAELQAHPTRFRFVYHPGQSSFFKRNGLLYLDIPDLLQVEERLTEAEPFLGTLSRDPSLRGLFSILMKALDNQLPERLQVLVQRILDRIGDTVEDQLAGRESPGLLQDGLLQPAEGVGGEGRRFVLAQPRLDYESLEAGGAAIDMVRRYADEIRQESPGRVRIRLTGTVAIAEDELKSVARGVSVAAILSFMLVSLILLFGLRSLRLVISVLTTLIVALGSTAAIAFLLIKPLNVMALSFPVFLIGLGVDYGIQFGLRYMEELKAGETQRNALEKTAAGLGGALTVAAMAAVITFLSFLPTKFTGMAQLGMISAMGMVIAWLASLTLLPALLTLLQPKPPAQATARFGRATQFVLVPARRRGVLISAAVVAAAAASLLPQVRYEFDPLQIGDPRAESARTFLELRDDHVITPYTVNILTEDLSAAQDLATRLAALEGVDKVLTLASYVPTDQEDKLTIIEDLNVILAPLTVSTPQPIPPSAAEQRVAASEFQETLRRVSVQRPESELSQRARRLGELLQRLTIAEPGPADALEKLEDRLLGDLPRALTQIRLLLSASPISLDDLPEELRIRYIAADGRARVEVMPREDVTEYQALVRFVHEIQRTAPEATSMPVFLVEGGETALRSCLQATGLTLLGLVPILLLLLSSIRDTLLVLLPLMLTMLLTLASSVLLGVSLNFANVIILPLVFGLGIAYGTYLVMRQRTGLDTKDLLHSSTPLAVLFSALTTIGSFGTLALSAHRGIASIGLLLTLALSYALVCNLVILPAILGQNERRKSEG
ncbi:MAG: MMPL family transporter [Nitrospiraceae bacterium]